MFLTWKRFTALSYHHQGKKTGAHLSHATTTMSATDRLHMTSALLRTTVISILPLEPIHDNKSNFLTSSISKNTYLRLNGMTK